MEEIGFVEDGELHSNRLCSVAQLHPTLCYSMDCMLPSSSVHGIFQARIPWLPFPTPGDLPDLGNEPASLASPALAGGLLTIAPRGKPPFKSR